MSSINPFSDPIFVTKPILPEFDVFSSKLKSIWETSKLTNNGPQLKTLESKLREKLNVAHLSLFNNGTSALLLACRCLNLEGEVITTPFTFPATPHVLTWNKLEPVFCDVDPDTFTINPELIESLITPKTSAILAVHVFGIPCNVDRIQEIADRFGLRVIYDAAHAFGVEIDGKGIGSFGDVSMFSFHATKLFHTAEGGALTFNDREHMRQADLLKNFGIWGEDEVLLPGLNAKMNEIQAALGICMLDCIDEEREKRKQLFDVYRRGLEGVEGIRLIEQTDVQVKPGYQYCVVQIDENLFGCTRDYVHTELKKYNVFARKYFHPLCSNYDYYSQLPSADVNNLPVANKIAHEVLSLPFYGDLGQDTAEKICEILTMMKR